MNGAVQYTDATVTVKDSAGKECAAKIVKKAKGNIKVQITGLEKGKTYTITINGVKAKKEKNYGSITKTITDCLSVFSEVNRMHLESYMKLHINLSMHSCFHIP